MEKEFLRVSERMVYLYNDNYSPDVPFWSETLVLWSREIIGVLLIVLKYFYVSLHSLSDQSKSSSFQTWYVDSHL